MLWTIFVILMIMWLLGLVSGYTIGGFIHSETTEGDFRVLPIIKVTFKNN